MRKKPGRNKGAANPRDKAQTRLKAKRQGMNRPTAAAKPRRLARRLHERTSDLQRSTSELMKEIDFEKLLADLSARFVNVPSDLVDREIRDAQRRVCECLGLDLSALWQWPAENPRSLVMTHLFQPPGFPPTPERMDADEFFPWCQKLVLAGKVIVVSSMEELPAEAARDQEIWRQLGIKTNLTFPLSTGGEPTFGAMSFNDTRRERTWPEELVKRLQLVAQIFANALARRRADRMLRESEERLELAAESAGAGLWSLNLGTGCYWLTRKTRELFGFAPDEAVTHDRFLSLVHPEDRELVRETVKMLVQSKNEGHIRYRILRPDGSLRWISSRGRVRCKASGEPDSLMGVSLDVTEQKQTEAALHDLADRYRVITTTTTDGFWEVDDTGKILEANDECCRLYGYSREELLNKSIQDFEATRNPAETLAHIESIIATGYSRFETRHRRKDGRIVDVEVSTTYRPGSGTFLTFLRDISERKRAEEALRASEEVSRTTFEQAAVGMAHVGTDGRWLRVNDKLCAIVGYQRDELMKLTFQDITQPEDLETDLDYVRRVLSGEIKTYSMEKRYIRKDRSVVWIYLTVSLVRTGAGEPKHFISVVEDITERKKAEAELKRLRLHLWHADRVAQTAAVTASLAHELNQPLAAILTNAQVGLQWMAGGNPDLEEIREILTDIVEDDKRAGAVVSGLRDLLHRKETGRESINPADTIRRIIAMLHSEFLDKEVQLRLELEPDLSVLVNKAQIQQVILNLVMNAIEAMQGQPAGQRRLELTMTHTDAGEALVAVRDSGPGILEDRPEKVFEAFWTTKQEGLGLGLMISRSIIESHRGRLWFANNPDQGVTFYFTIPLIIDPESAGRAAGIADP
jgi:PAS domain S-box-containing protein